LPFANGLPEPNPDRLVSQTIRKSEVLPKD